MEHFYVTLASDSSGYYFSSNTIANFKAKLATPIELTPDEWEVGLLEISYPKGCKKLFLPNTHRLDSEEISFPVKHHESVYDLLTHLPYFWEPYKRDKFISKFSEYINKYEAYKKYKQGSPKVPSYPPCYKTYSTSIMPPNNWYPLSSPCR